MALLRPRLEHELRHENKEFQWQDSSDDMFDSFINPDSFGGDGQRHASNDFIAFLETHASSSGDDSPEFTTLQPPEDWPTVAPTFEDELPERFGRNLSIYSNGRGVSSDTNLIVLPTDDVEDEHSHSITAPSTPRWRTRSRQPADTPISVRKRQSSASPSKIGKNQRRVTTGRRMSPHKASHGGGVLARRFQDADASGQLDVKVPPSQCRLATPPPSANMRPASFEWDPDLDQPVRSPGPFDDEFDRAPLSPRINSNGYSSVQHRHTPAKRTRSPAHANDRVTSSSDAEPQPDGVEGMSSYPSSPLAAHGDNFTLTPPDSHPMNGHSWTPQESFMQQHHSHAAGPENGMGSAGIKAEPGGWEYTASDAHEVTCGAPAANFGLGISCGPDDAGNANGVVHQQQGFGNGYSTPQQQHFMHAGPTPRNHGRPMSGDFTGAHIPRSALSQQQNANSMYPMSPLMDHGLNSNGNSGGFNGNGYTLSPPSQQRQAANGFSPTPAQFQKFKHHRRSRTVGAPIATIPPSLLTKPAYAGLSFPAPDILSPPLSTPRTTRAMTNMHHNGASTNPPTPRHHQQRSKSSHYKHHSRSKSVGGGAGASPAAVNVGFVNFTPDDSKRILTGVAPSGSSKTKARREREAAERRRKLSEAAKKAVLRAGGDLEALERECLGFD